MLLQCSETQEDAFGPIVRGCGSGFDLTLRFEEDMLFIVPLSVAIGVAIVRMVRLSMQKVVVGAPRLLAAKMALYSFATLAQAATLGIALQKHAFRTSSTVVALGIGVAGWPILLGLSWLEHRRSLRPSSLLSLYLLGSLPANGVRARTLWSIRSNEEAAAAFTAFGAIAALIIPLELRGKHRSFITPHLLASPEERSGILARAFVGWVFPLFKAGYRRKLEFEDLITIDGRICTNHLAPAHEGDGSRLFARRQSTPNQNPNSGGRPAQGGLVLLIRIVKALRGPILSPILPRLCLLALTLTQPFLIAWGTDFIARSQQPDRYKVGGLLVAAYAATYVGLATTNALYLQKASRLTSMIRGSLVAQLCEKCLRLDVTTASKSSGTTLMSNDVERIELGFRRLHDIWAGFAAAAFGVWVVKTRLGVAVFVALGCAGGAAVIALVLSVVAIKHQKNWQAATEQRLATTLELLTNIKSVKLMGYSQIMDDLLNSKRQLEIRRSHKFRSFLIAIITLSYASLTVCPAVGIVTHSLLARSGTGPLLDPSLAFSSLAWFSIVSVGLTDAIESTFGMVTAIGCIQRIQNFMIARERNDLRLPVMRSPHNWQYCVGDAPEENSFHQDILDTNNHLNAPAIKLRHVCVKWEAQAAWTLEDVSIDVPRGKLTVIVGPTGCGKSTLLKTILGESRYRCGSITTTSQEIGYCGHAPWLPGRTIRTNVIGPLHFDEDRYKQAVEACALHVDALDSTSGEELVAGTDGLKLSGGQKARIELARVVYARLPIAVLDDCFASLDDETEARIFQNLFGAEGHFRCEGITVVLATSSRKHLSSADHVIELNQHGKVAFQGIYKGDAAFNRAAQEGLTARLRAGGTREQFSRPNPQVAEIETLTTAAAPGEDMRKTDHTYRALLAAGGWSNMVIFFILCAIFIFCIVYPQIFLRTWTEDGSRQQRRTVDNLLAIYLGSVGVACAAFAVACTFFMLRIGVRFSTEFHLLLLKAVIRAPIQFFATTDNGVIINRFSQDLQLIDQEIPISLIGVVVAILQLLAQCVVIVMGSPYTGLAIPALALVVVIVQHVYLRTSRQLRLLDLECKAPLFSHFLQSLEGLATIRAFGWSAEFAHRGFAAMQTSQVPFYLLLNAQTALGLVLDLITALLAVGVISIAAFTHTASSAGLGLALFNIVGLAESVKALIQTWTTLEVSLGAVARIVKFPSATPCEQDMHSMDPPPDWPTKGEISLSNIVITYPDDVCPTITNLDLSIKGGSKIGIIGPSGSGKTTLISALFRMVELSSGHIVVDGIDITKLARSVLRTRLVIIPQEPLVLNMGLREFMTLRSPCTDEALVTILQEVGLWDIFKQHHGLDTILTEDILSQGQRQILSFAIASLTENKIVVMDEPSSSVDANVQTLMCRLTCERFRESTVICVAHRLETLLDFDAIVVMERGRVVQFGRPEDILLSPKLIAAESTT